MFNLSIFTHSKEQCILYSMQNHSAKNRPAQSYEEISLIDYLVTVKRNKKIIFLIAPAICVILVLSFTTIKKMYESGIFLSIGNVKGEAFESGVEAASYISHFDSDASIAQEEGGKALSIVIEKSTREEVERETQRLSDFILAHNADTMRKKLEPLDENISFLKGKLKNEDNRLNNLQTMINRFNPLDYAQALTLQAYMQSYDNASNRKFELENNLQRANADRANFQETSIQKNSVRVISPLGKILRNTIIAIIIGFILGTLCALAKEWWKANKELIK